MANYYCTYRSNYFRVKDAEVFRKFIAQFGNLFLLEEDDKFGFYDESGEAGMPGSYRDQESGDDIEVDFMEELAKHLADEEVAIVMEAGAEKCRYVSGYAIAVNNKGEIRTVSLNDIYQVAKSLGKNVTPAEY